MSRKNKNTREKELREKRHKEERKKKDERTLRAIKYALIAFGSMFLFMLIGWVWQEFEHKVVMLQTSYLPLMFVGAGLLISARYWKKCRDNIEEYHVLFKLYTLLFVIFFTFAGSILFLDGLADFLRYL